MTRRRLLVQAVLLTAVLALSGCVTLPQDGPIQTEVTGEQANVETTVDFTPDGPTPGAPPAEIVRGFLVAMQATPLSTTVARRFLSSGSATSWVPERGTIIYESEQREQREDDDVRLTLSATVGLDVRGAWQGKQGTQAFDLEMVKERGEWRISDPPDRLIIPLSHFQARFTQYALFFFDKTASVLVPEPVYVPSGPQATTFLANGLLRGPHQQLLGVERTFIPASTVLDDISVPVSREGTVQVPLSDDILDLDPRERNLAFAQLAETLGQVPGVQRMRVTVDGSPLELADGAELRVDRWDEFSPTVSWASEELFGIRDGRVVALADDRERRVSGAAGSLDLGLREIGVDLAGQRVAGTTDDGRVMVTRRSREPGTLPDENDVSTVFSGAGRLLKPAWDLHGRLWLVDRTRSGSAIHLVGGGDVRELQAEGLTGADIRSFVLSRDGTRLVAEIAGEERDRLVAARIQRDNTGRVRRISGVQTIPLQPLEVQDVRDVAWRSPDSLAVLTVPSEGTSQVLVVKIDGSSTRTEAATGAEVFPDEAGTLVTTSTLGAPLFIRTLDGHMFELAPNGRWTGAGIEPGLRSPTFVG